MTPPFLASCSATIGQDASRAFLQQATAPDEQPEPGTQEPTAGPAASAERAALQEAAPALHALAVHVGEATWTAFSRWESLGDMLGVADGLYLDDGFRESYDRLSSEGAAMLLRQKAPLPAPLDLASRVPPWQAFLHADALRDVSKLLEERYSLGHQLLSNSLLEEDVLQTTNPQELRRQVEDFLYDVETPPEIADGVMGAFRADVALIALLEAHRTGRMLRAGQLSSLLELLRVSLKGVLFLARVALGHKLSEEEEAKLRDSEHYSLLMQHGPEKGRRYFEEMEVRRGA